MEVDVYGFKGISTDAIINPQSTFIIAGYWWGRGNVNRNSREGKTYDQLADRLIDICIGLNINYCMIEIPEFAVKGGYQKAINFKPLFIKYMMVRYPTLLICTLDTDMHPVRYPYLFENPDYDFIVFNWNSEPRTINGPISCYTPYTLRTSGGLICMRYGQETMRLAEEWADYSVRYPGKADDRTITAVFESRKYIERLRCLWVPMEYLWIPYFYELEFDYKVSKQDAKLFGKKVDKSGYSVREYTVQELFDVKNSDVMIVHPEALTEEEVAASEGADPDRVPYIWYYYSGIKRRCLSNKNKLVINPTLFCTSAKHIEELTPMNSWKDKLGLSKYSKKTLKFKHKINPEALKGEARGDPSSSYVVVSICDDDSQTAEFSRYLSSFNITHMIFTGKQLRSIKPFLIHTVLENLGKDVVYMDSNSIIGMNNIQFDIDCDFECINASATPVYRRTYIGKPCSDSRILQCVTTDILCFKNSFFAKNLLLAWDNEIKKGIQDRISLSIAFNKYGFIIPMKVKWINPSVYAYDESVYIPGYFEGAWTFRTDSPLPKWTRRIDMYNYLEQCGIAPPVTSNEGDEDIYFESLPYNG